MRKGSQEQLGQAQSSQENLIIRKGNQPSRSYRNTLERKKEEINLQNHQKTSHLALQKIDPKGLVASSLILNFSGSIEFAELYEGQDDLQVSYVLKWGEEWREDPRDPLKQPDFSQYCEAKEGIVTFDLPFEGTLSSSGTPNSWPHLIMIFKGFDALGHKITKGYAQMHFPISAGRSEGICHIYAPQSNSSLYQRFKAWLTGTSMQYKRDFQKIIIRGEGREVGRVRCIGAVKIVFNLIMRNLSSFGYQ